MGKTVLFVDDDEMWRTRVIASFGAAGYDVVTAKDASEAMTMSEGRPLGVIILDLDLNGENGIMLMKFLKRNHPAVPVILFTCVEHDEPTIRSMLEMGADQYLPKNSIEELIVAVGPYL